MSLFILLGVSLTLILTKRITSPLNRLNRADQEVSEGKLDHDLEVSTADEIADLARAFNHMSMNLRNSRREVEEQTRELVVASDGRPCSGTQTLKSGTDPMNGSTASTGMTGSRWNWRLQIISAAWN